MNKKVIIKLFSNCIPVHGYRRSVICDLQRNKYIMVPHDLISMFDDTATLHKETIENTLNNEDKSIFLSYLNILEQHELIFYCEENELSSFSPLSMKWDSPAIINNMIIDINNYSLHNYNKILFDAVENLRCSYFQLRHYDASSLNFWDDIMLFVNSSNIQAIDIILKDSPDNFSHTDIANWVYKNRKIRALTIHSSIEEKIIQAPDFGFSSVVAIKEKIRCSSHCGVVHPSYFTINIPTYTESLAHNSCLNRKIAIDIEGNIKNCPSMKESFGNIKDTTLEEAINKPGFKKYWNISKDQITKCKDCEFRYICIDCRAYIENPEEIYSAPLKCGYDPYTCEWEEWSTSPLKQQAIEYYGMQDLVKNKTYKNRNS